MPSNTGYRIPGGGRKKPPTLSKGNVASVSSRGTASSRNQSIAVGGAPRSRAAAIGAGRAPLKRPYLARGIAAGAAPLGRGELRKEPPGGIRRPIRKKPIRKASMMKASTGSQLVSMVPKNSILMRKG